MASPPLAVPEWRGSFFVARMMTLAGADMITSSAITPAKLG
jgi:hypothetical protein